MTKDEFFELFLVDEWFMNGYNIIIWLYKHDHELCSCLCMTKDNKMVLTVAFRDGWQGVSYEGDVVDASDKFFELATNHIKNNELDSIFCPSRYVYDVAERVRALTAGPTMDSKKTSRTKYAEQ